MSELRDRVRRARSYRSSAIEISYICALLAISFFARQKAASIAERGDPRIAVADLSLAALLQKSDTLSESVDPQVTSVASQKRDLEIALRDRIDFWFNVRAASFLALVLASVLALISFVRHVFSTEDDGPTSIAGRRGNRGSP